VKPAVLSTTVDPDGLATLLVPRVVPASEEPARWDRDDGGLHRTGMDPELGGTCHFDLAGGPFTAYRRELVIRPAPDGEPGARRRWAVTQTCEFRLAVPVWWVAFRPLVKRSLRGPGRAEDHPWWLPEGLDARAAHVLSVLCLFAVIAGYLGVLLSQTNAYFQREFDVSNSAVSDAQIATRIGALLALLVVALADRRGRKPILVTSTYLAIVVAATGALVPNLFWLSTSQGLARAFSAAMALLVVIISAEEMPASARAFAVSVLTMAGGLGAGGVVCLLWIGDLGTAAWRVFYLIPLASLVVVPWLARAIPETRRFEVFELSELSRTTHARQGRSGTEPSGTGRRRAQAARFAMLGASGLLLAVFLIPSAGFLNNFLLNEQHWPGWEISVFQVATNVPFVVVVLVAGRWADERGRRHVATVGVLGMTVATTAMFLSTGVWIWVFSTFATIGSALIVPSLGVYQAELFGTGRRGRANGGLNLLAVIGSVIGLKTVGLLADRFGSFGPAMAAVAVAPLLVAAIVVLWFPETSHLELEQINPDDLRLPEGDPELDDLDRRYRAQDPHGPDEGQADGERADEERAVSQQADRVHPGPDAVVPGGPRAGVTGDGGTAIDPG
jgi:MFS family permease